MNFWLLAATLLLLGFVPCGWVVFRAQSLLDRLVALQLANILGVLILLLLSIGTQRSSFGDLAVALALLGLPGGLVYVHFLEQGVMTLRAIMVVALLGGGVLVELLCCVGVLLMRRAVDRLHFLGPASFLGTGLIAAAILVNRSGFQAGVKAVVIFLALLVFSPILSHATGRAIQLTEGRRDGVGDQASGDGARTGVPEGQP